MTAVGMFATKRFGLSSSTSLATALLLSVLLALTGCAEGGGGQVRPVVDGGNDSAGPLMMDGGGPDGSDEDAPFEPGDDDDDTTGDDDDDDTSGDDDDDTSGDDDDDDDTVEPDAGPPVECSRDADCDDGNPCNGVETCDLDECFAGIDLDCDDEVPCTADSCSPATGCQHRAEDGRCGGGMLCDPSDGCVSGCPADPCRLVSPQCGCPSGQGCYASGSTTRICATAGSLAEGATCTATTSCAPGNMCLNIATSGRSNAMCLHFCTVDADCGTDTRSRCLLEFGSAGATADTRLCTRACDPVTSSGCPSGAACSVFQEGSAFLTDCTAPADGTGGQGARCETDEECQPGFGCIDSDGAGDGEAMCHKWCRVGTACPAGSGECNGFSPTLVLGSVEYGACS